MAKYRDKPCKASEAEIAQALTGAYREEHLFELKPAYEVCHEASCGYGNFHDLLQPLTTRVLVAHPGQLRLIFRSKNKNDRNDAERLAKLLYLGETPTVHVPALEVRTWRELINCRSHVIAKRTRAKNTVCTMPPLAFAGDTGGDTFVLATAAMRKQLPPPIATAEYGSPPRPQGALLARRTLGSVSIHPAPYLVGG